MKEPSIIRTKKLYLPLSGNNYENKEPFVEGPVPAQVSDKKTALKTIESTVKATKTIDTFNIGIYLLASLLSIGMATLWGSVRALQMIFDLLLRTSLSMSGLISDLSFSWEPVRNSIWIDRRNCKEKSTRRSNEKKK